MQHFLLALLLLVAPSLHAQVKLEGTLIDSLSGEAVPYAGILLKGTTTGTAANAEGNFRLFSSQLPVTLVITAIGYRTTTVECTVKDTVLRIRLSRSIRQFGEVVIEATVLRRIQDDVSLMAVDFEFYDDFILLLAHRDFVSPSQLILTDAAGKRIATLALKRNAERLFRDCLGNVHLLTPDSSWQIYYDYERLQLLYPTSRAELERNLLPCQLFHKGKLYLQVSSYKNLRMHYYVSAKGKSSMFYYACDTAAITYYNTKYDMRYFLAKRRRGEGYLYPVRVIRENADAFRAAIPNDPTDAAFLRPLQAPLILHDSAVWVVQFADSCAIRFTDNEQPGDTVQLHLNNTSRQLIRDEVTDELYTTSVKKGITQIWRLNAETLQPEFVTEIEAMPFITELKIRNGFAYFLFIDRYSSTNRMLFRLPL